MMISRRTLLAGAAAASVQGPLIRRVKAAIVPQAVHFNGATELTNTNMPGFPAGGSRYGFISFSAKWYQTGGWICAIPPIGQGAYVSGPAPFQFGIGPGTQGSNYNGIYGGIAPQGGYGFAHPAMIPWSAWPLNQWHQFMMAWDTQQAITISGNPNTTGQITQAVIKVYVNNTPQSVVLWYYPADNNFAYTPWNPVFNALTWKVGLIDSLTADVADLFVSQGVNYMTAIDDTAFRDYWFDQDTGYAARQAPTGTSPSQYFGTFARPQIFLSGPAKQFPLNFAAAGGVFPWPGNYVPPSQSGSFTVTGTLTTAASDPFAPGGSPY